MLNQIVATTCYSIKRELKKSAYWASILWVPSLLVLLSMFITITNTSAPTFNSKMVATTWEALLGGGVFAITLLFSAMTVRELFNDRATKINELLWAMSSPEAQFYGKLGAMNALIGSTLLLYISFILGVMSFVPWFNHVIRDLWRGLSGGQLLLGLLLLVEIIEWVELAAAHLATKITNKTHINQAVVTLNLAVGLAVYVSLFASLSESRFIQGLAYVLPVFSQLRVFKAGWDQPLSAVFLAMILVSEILLLGLYFAYVRYLYVQRH